MQFGRSLLHDLRVPGPGEWVGVFAWVLAAPLVAALVSSGQRPRRQRVHLGDRYSRWRRTRDDWEFLGRGSHQPARGVVAPWLPRRDASLQGTCGGAKEDTYFWHWWDATFDIPVAAPSGSSGPNGLGKSTALKVMAGITGPPTVRSTCAGALSALLELGCGFHPLNSAAARTSRSTHRSWACHVADRRVTDEIIEFADPGNTSKPR